MTTDVLVLDISLTGGTLVRAELPGYPIVKGEAAPVVLFNTDQPSTNYVLRTGLANPEDAERARRTWRRSRRTADSFTLASGQDELRVPLTWTDGKGVTVTKTFVFKRSMFAIGLEYADRQRHAGSVARGVRTRASCASDPPVERSMFKVESYATRGPVIYDGDQVPQARHREARTTRRCRSRSRTAGSPACSITS